MDSRVYDICLNCLRQRSGGEPCPHCGAAVGQAPWTHGNLKPGVILADKYLLGRALGRGGFAVTYLAARLDLGSRVAIKEYFPSELADRDPRTCRVTPRRTGGAVAQYENYFQRGLRRFIKEGRLIVHCHEPTPHPNLVRVTDFFEANGTAYLVMDYVEGISLEQHLESQPGGKLVARDAVRILMPVLDGLRAVHKRGLYHRDVKPANIYLSNDGPVILLDFGSARTAVRQETKTRTILLTPGYAPPEQYSERGDQGPWSDIYGCAATLYRCVTGAEPVSALDRLTGVPLARPSEMPQVQIPHKLDKAICAGLAIDRRRRPQSANMYQKMLEEALTGNTIASASSAAATENAAKPVIAATGNTHALAPVPQEKSRNGLLHLGLGAASVGGFLIVLLAGGWFLATKSPKPELTAPAIAFSPSEIYSPRPNEHTEPGAPTEEPDTVRMLGTDMDISREEKTPGDATISDNEASRLLEQEMNESVDLALQHNLNYWAAVAEVHLYEADRLLKNIQPGGSRWNRRIEEDADKHKRLAEDAEVSWKNLRRNHDKNLSWSALDREWRQALNTAQINREQAQQHMQSQRNVQAGVQYLTNLHVKRQQEIQRQTDRQNEIQQKLDNLEQQRRQFNFEQEMKRQGF